MSFTSIGRYLSRGAGKHQSDEETAAVQSLDRFASGVLDHINRFVLTGEDREPLRLELIHLRESLGPSLDEDGALASLNLVARVLAQHQSISQQTTIALGTEVQHIFAMLNQALIVLADGRDKSVSRLNEIHDLLRRTSMLQDIVALKSSLAETMRFVQAESVQGRDSVSEELDRFGVEVTRAREFLGSSRIELGRRPEAVSRISQSLEHLPSGEAVYVVAYLLDRLHAMTQRYGPAVAEEMIFRLIRERLQPLAAANGAYRWTSSSLVGVFQRSRDLDALRTEVTNLNRTPVVHRIALGNRTAVLTMSPAHLVAEGTQKDSRLVEEIDEFTGGHQ